MSKLVKTKMSIAIVIVTVLSVLLVPAAYAAETTGQFSAQASPPTIDAIGVFSNSACTIPVTGAAGMTPLTEYWAKLTVTSKNKLSYLDTVTATIYYDSAGSHPAPGGANTKTCAIFTWHSSGTTWTRDSGGPPTTWTIETGDCTAPAVLTGKTGDWIFAFKPGKVATQSTGAADWDAEGKATNKAPQTSTPGYYTAMAMYFYGEVAVTGTADWGDVDLGLVFEDAPPNSQVVSNINYIANGNYDENIKSGATWSDGGTETVALDETGGNPPSADGQFALKADDTATLASAVVVKATSATAIDDTGTITDEGGDDVATNNLWLSLSAAGIAPATYTGAIFYEITNR